MRCIVTSKTSHEHATVVDDEGGHKLWGQEVGVNRQKKQLPAGLSTNCIHQQTQ